MIPLPFIFSLLGNWQRVLIYGLVVLFIGTALVGYGYMKGSQRLYEYQADQARAAVVIVTRQGAVTVRVVTQWRTVDRVIEKQGETIIKEVPVYVTAQDDAACRIPDGFIRLWNDANTGRVPDAAGRPDDPARRPGNP